MIASGANEPPAALMVLSDADAVALLRSHHLGRVAFAHESWPVILPVNYAYDDPNVVVRIGRGAMLESVPLHATAFEIDEASPDGEWGWSVLVQGPAFDITEATDERSIGLRHLVLTQSAPGVHEYWLEISAVRLSGRYFGRKPGVDGTV